MTCALVCTPLDIHTENMWNINKKNGEKRVCVWARIQAAACPVCCRQMKSNIIRFQRRYNTFHIYINVCMGLCACRLRATHFSIIFCAISKPIKGDRLRQNYSATKLFVFRQINIIYIRNIVLFFFFYSFRVQWSVTWERQKNELESANESSIFHMRSDEIEPRFREVVVLCVRMPFFLIFFLAHKPDFDNFRLVNCGVCSTHTRWK